MMRETNNNFLTEGRKLRAAREEAGISLAEIGYNPGYLSRVERGFLPISSGVLAAYKATVGHHIDVIPQAGSAPKRRETRGSKQPKNPPASLSPEEIAYLRGFIDGACWMDARLWEKYF